MPRLFTGVEIPADVGQSLSMLRGGLPGARWITPENYHLTLRFIGDVDDLIAQEVALMLARIKRDAFDLYLEGLTSFGGRKPRAVVASVAQAQALLDVQAEQERLMQRIGLEPEGRKYTPHVTLARLRDSSSHAVAEYLSARGYFRTAAFRVSRFVLFSSRASVAQAQALLDMQAEHERLMQRIGLQPEGRKYTPHVTLARLRDSSSHAVAEYLSARGYFRTAAFRVSRFVLFSSRASVGGGPYVVEASYPLS